MSGIISIKMISAEHSNNNGKNKATKINLVAPRSMITF